MANEWLSAAEITQIRSDIRNCIEGLGAGHSVSITYTAVSARTVSATSDAISETSSSFAVTSGKFGPISKKTDRGLEQGLYIFRIESARLSDQSVTEPARTHRITYAGDDYEIAEWSRSAGSGFWDILVRKVGT